MAQIFSGKSWILLGQSHITTALREEDMVSGRIIKEVMFSSGFKICFVRIHSLALRPNGLLHLTLAGNTGTAGPLSSSQLPSSATLKKFLLSAFFISNVCELRFCLFFNQKNIKRATREVRLDSVLCHPLIKRDLLVMLFRHIVYYAFLPGSQISFLMW